MEPRSSNIKVVQRSNRPGESAHRGLARDPQPHYKENLIHHLLQLLHWQCPHGLRRWLGLENARFFREWVHSFPGWRRWLLLELKVERSSKLECAVFLQLTRSNRNDALHDSVDLVAQIAKMVVNRFYTA